MAEDFDIGPLTWVKDEIDQALKSVLDNLAAVTAKPEDVAALKFSQTHLYQVSGALDMVGLEGCKRFCAEMEKLAGKLEKQLVPVSAEVLETLTLAVNALGNYLQDLLHGAADKPMRLFPVLQSMVRAQGESVEESELFFPDTSLHAPKNLPSKPREDAASYIAEQRGHFQKSLLLWLKDRNADGLQGMRSAIENVQLVQQLPAQKTLWWVVSAFTDALSQDEIAENTGAKKLCRRIDQQLRSLATENARASGNLLRDALYYVALSAPGTECIVKVKEIFELDDLLAAPAGRAAAPSEISAIELQAVDQLNTLLSTFKETWADFSEQKPAALDNFLLQLGEIIDPTQHLTNTAVSHLFGHIHELATALDLDASKVTETALMEVASALNLLEDALAVYRRPDADMMQRLAAQAQRLQDIMGGGPMSSGATMLENLDSSVLLAVAQQVKDALKTCEQALDTYFRNPAEQQVLQAADKPLQQVVAAFDMLDMYVPASIAKASATLVDYFHHQLSEPNPGLFELVAESLSMLGFYVEELPRVRPEAEVALEVALDRLHEELGALGLGPVSGTELNGAVESVAVTAGELSPDKTGSDVEHSGVVDAGQETTDRAFDPELLDIYLTEAEEVLATVAQNLQTLRVNPTDHEPLVEVRRGFHTLKGSGRTVGLTALGDVAWGVEKLLNGVMERKVVPSPAQLTFIEQTSAAFAGWVATLRDAGVVTLNQHEWLLQATALEDASASQQPVALAAEVVIGGTHKISRGLFDIFMNEAGQHMQHLKQEFSGLSADLPSKPTETSIRAAHTLASNAGTAGFKAMGDLARALEHWFDAHQGQWTTQSLSLLDNVINALAGMLDEVRQLRQPKKNSALLAALKDATIQAASIEAIEAGATEVITEAAASISVEELPGIETQPEITTINPPENSAVPTEAQPASVSQETTAETPVQVSSVDEQLLTMFIEEARELVPLVGNELRAWRANPQESDHPDSLQRALHTLKGSARMAGQAELGDTVHSMEDRVMRALKNKVKLADFDDLFVDLDRIGSLLEAAVGTATTDGPASAEKLVVASPGRSADRKTQYLRLRADVLDRLINEAGEISIARSRMDREMQGFKQFSLDLTESVFRLRNYLRELEIEAESQLQSRLTHLQETHETFDPLEFDRFTRLQELTRMLAESVNDVATIQHGLLMNLDETESALQQQNRMNRELQHGLMNVRMVPFSLISERLQRIVRQTARELEKRVEMTIDGEGVEIDRSVLDKIGAPLEHLLRNAVAHGMETPAKRKKLGKSEVGNVTLRVRRESDEIVLTVTDDGAGINLQRVREKAIQNGLVQADQEINEQALLSVIFEPGFSTADSVTQIAGRGVGLDAVRSDITALAGRIDVTNSEGQGAVFSIYLPVTLSVAQIVLIRAGSRIFALPSVMVEQVQKLKPAALADAYAQHTILWSDRKYPLHYLAKLIGDADQTPEDQRYTPLLLLRSGTYRIALHVDEIISNQEVVMKAIGPQLARVPGMVGATVMGDGSIILIINPVQLANREVLAAGSVKSSVIAPVAVDNRPVVMVVDDSLTMRKVLGRLLEREGYQVITAKDGMDALQTLQERLPDIILTDIEMPRMDGFGLARNVRDDARTANIPLIVISSRTAEKHRNLAQEIGVNAYLGKPVQDGELIAEISLQLGRAIPPVVH